MHHPSRLGAEGPVVSDTEEPAEPAAAAERGFRQAVEGSAGRPRPSALDIARLSRKRGLAEGRAQLYRHIARLTDLEPGHEFLIVPAATGSATRFLATVSGAQGAGVDPDPDLVEHATERARAAGLATLVHFDQGSPLSLPYTDEVFDVVIGEIGLSASEPPQAVGELVRVARPGAAVLLVQPVWTADVAQRRREVLIGRLGLRPALPQRWKQLLREAGVESLLAEDLSDVASSRTGAASVRTLTDFFAVRDRLHVAFQAWKRWGWAGVSAVLGREQELYRLVSGERVLGLSLIRGTKRVDPAADGDSPERVAEHSQG